LAPVDLIAILYLGRLLILFWPKMPTWGKVPAMVMVLVILLQDLSLSAFAMFERKNVIHAKAELASVVETQYERDPREVVKLFFPFADPYLIMEFAAYLSYRGVPLSSVALYTPAVAKDAPCVNYEAVRCRALNWPTRGDLVIVLPEDEVSLAAASVYREGGTLVLFYKPRPSMPHCLYAMVGNLPLATGKYQTRPDRWMDASVTMWR
jgi:hypothetical protein